MCPVCKNATDLPSHPELGQHVVCQVCKTTLEVTWLYPLSLDTIDDQSNQSKDKRFSSDASISGN
jgi:lysine biosynthesis protein LysW